jgi:hypothetical protein
MRSSFTRLALIVAPVLVGACGGSLAPASNGSMASPSDGASPTMSPVASSSPSPALLVTPDPTESHAAAPESIKVQVGSVVSTLASDGLRVRSEPRVSEDSQKLVPLLPLGTQLLVLGGPVTASGYDWYDVVPLTSRKLPSGWVASADRDGEPWVAASDFDCPPVPTDLRSLAALPPGVGLACFSRVPITVDARLISCNCDIDGSWYSPSWFFLASGSPALLVEPDVTTVPSDMTDWFVLNLDPTGEHPDNLPIGQVVGVTGIFDHPAAASCTRTEMDGEPVSSQSCRLAFAVTHLLLYGP